MLQKVEENIKMLRRELEYIYIKRPKLKLEIKNNSVWDNNTLDGINSKLDTTEEGISHYEDIVIEI